MLLSCQQGQRDSRKFHASISLLDQAIVAITTTTNPKTTVPVRPNTLVILTPTLEPPAPVLPGLGLFAASSCVFLKTWLATYSHLAIGLE
jgi:hypothetical protein